MSRQGLRLSFEVEGEKELSKVLLNVSKNLKNFRDEFKSTGRHLLKTFQDNFATAGSTLGQPWPRLAQSTIRQKIALGYAGSGPLIRTGRMKRSFRSDTTKESVTISNPTPYFKYHQSKAPRRKIPRRVMMAIDDKRKQEIIKIFEKSIEKILKARS